MSISSYDEVRGMVVTLVTAERANGRVATSDSIAAKINAIMDMYGGLKGEPFTRAVDRAALQRDIEGSFNVFIADANLMSDDSDHQPWLEAELDDINWRFWERYRQ